MQQCIKMLLLHIYMNLNMFRATHRPSSGAENYTGSLWVFIRGRMFGSVVGGRCQAQYVPDNVHQLHVQQPSTYEKPKAASAVLGS
jgi:hypothetical protein